MPRDKLLELVTMYAEQVPALSARQDTSWHRLARRGVGAPWNQFHCAWRWIVVVVVGRRGRRVKGRAHCVEAGWRSEAEEEAAEEGAEAGAGATGRGRAEG